MGSKSGTQTGGKHGQYHLSPVAARNLGAREQTSPGLLLVRPEKLRPVSTDKARVSGEASVNATITAVAYLGSASKYDLRTADGTRVVVRSSSAAADGRWKPGDTVAVRWHTEDVALIDGDGTSTVNYL